jgi:hypothetical protein
VKRFSARVVLASSYGVEADPQPKSRLGRSRICGKYAFPGKAALISVGCAPLTLAVDVKPQEVALSKAPHRDVWEDQALSRYPVLKIHPTAAMHKTKKAMIMARLTPALISEVP